MIRGTIQFALVFVLAVVPNSCAAADMIEFLSGAKVEGTVTRIDKENKIVKFSAKIGQRSFEREYPYNKIHAVTYNEKRYVLNAKGAAAAAGNPAAVAAGKAGNARSKADVVALIKQAGSIPPDWFDSTPVDHPPGLDLSWQEPAPGPWDNQKNVGQYIWDIINPNPGRWRSGVRLVHHLKAMHKDDSRIQNRGMRTLGGMYFIYFQDYARAAFWWQQAGTGLEDADGTALAECYWRLGNSAMAHELLFDPERIKPGNNTYRLTMIKLWGDMGQPNKAIKIAEIYARAGNDPHDAFLLAGDACRTAGRYKEALQYYQRVLDVTPSNPDRAKRTIDRARANVDVIRLFELSNVANTRDGTHAATTPAYEGPLKVEVVVNEGRIEKVEVTQHTEKQFYSALTDVPRQIIAKQGVKGVDATSRATITAEAIINATAKALAENQK